jgi:hypothetical protein
VGILGASVRNESAWQARRSLANAAVVACATAVAGCATGGSLDAPSQTGTIRIYVASQLTDWPARFVSYNHPDAELLAPFSKRLFDLGHWIPPYHCYYLDTKSEPSRVTLMGLIKAAIDKNGRGLFGGRLSQADVAIAHNNSQRLADIFIAAILSEAQGDPARVQQLLDASLEHDTRCSRVELRYLEIKAKLDLENKSLTVDENGRQVVVNNEPQPGYQRKLLYWIGEHENGVRQLRQTYDLIAGQLTTRLARSVPRVTIPPPAVARRELQVPPQRRPHPAPAQAHSGRITLNTAPLQEVEREAAATLKKLKDHCLLTATIQCG